MVRAPGFVRCLVDLLLAPSPFPKLVEAAFPQEIRAAVFGPGNPAARPAPREARPATSFNPLSFTIGDFLVKLCRLCTPDVADRLVAALLTAKFPVSVPGREYKFLKLFTPLNPSG
jgi:hypothetical protein